MGGSHLSSRPRERPRPRTGLHIHAAGQRADTGGEHHRMFCGNHFCDMNTDDVVGWTVLMWWWCRGGDGGGGG